MGQHHHQGQNGADGGGQSRAEDAKVEGEYEDVVADHIEDAASQHACRRQSRIVIISKKGGQHLVQQEGREDEQDRL